MQTSSPKSVAEPTSLHESFAHLYGSSHLGVVMADETKGVLDANDAFLEMIRYTRLEMQAGKIDWWGMTPEECRPLDVNALSQIRQYGVCVPYEKAFILRDGSRVPFLMGAVRLATDPVTWAAYTVNLTERNKAIAAEQKARNLQAQAAWYNQLAHEVNNPLAALTFVLHLLSTRPEFATGESKDLLQQAGEQLERISQTVRQFLILPNP